MPRHLCLPSHELMARMVPATRRSLSIGDVMVMRSTLVHGAPASKKCRTFLFFVVSYEPDPTKRYDPDTQLVPWNAIAEATTNERVVAHAIKSWIINIYLWVRILPLYISTGSVRAVSGALNSARSVNEAAGLAHFLKTGCLCSRHCGSWVDIFTNLHSVDLFHSDKRAYH